MAIPSAVIMASCNVGNRVIALTRHRRLRATHKICLETVESERTSLSFVSNKSGKENSKTESKLNTTERRSSTMRDLFFREDSEDIYDQVSL